MRVLIPSPLFSYTGGRREVDASGATLDEVMRDLDERFPGLRFRVVDEHGAIREHVRVWVSGALVRSLDVPVAPSDEVAIVAALSGG
jgi:molybdopterin converting factor small subunit